MLRRKSFCFGLLLQRFQRRDRDEGRRDGGRDSGAGADRERQRRERLQQQKRGQWNAYWQDKNAPRNVYNSSVCGVTPERHRCLYKRLGTWFQVPVGEGLQFRTQVMTYYWGCTGGYPAWMVSLGADSTYIPVKAQLWCWWTWGHVCMVFLNTCCKMLFFHVYCIVVFILHVFLVLAALFT